MIDKIKIGPIEYWVEFKKNLQTPSGDDLYGCVKFAESAIHIEAHMGHQRQRVTVLHEVIHAMFDQCGIPEMEEHIASMSFSMLALLKDNPKFVAWVVEDAGDARQTP